MTDFYCFVCDRPVEEDPCPTCGTATWRPTAGEGAPRTDEHLREIADKVQPPGQTPPETDLLASRPSALPDVADDEEPWFRRVLSSVPGRWAPVAALVVAGIVFLSVLTGPSGLEPEQTVPETPQITARTTTTIRAPGSSRDSWAPPPGSWMGAFAFQAARPETLYGPSMAAGRIEISAHTVIYDSLPDGTLVGVDSETQEVVLVGAGESGPFREATPLPEPGPQSTPPLVSPDGTRLAVIDGVGIPHVWIVDSDTVVSPRDSAATAVEAIAGMFWSPDSTILALNAFQGGHYLWDQVSGEVSRNVLPGRAIAVSPRNVAAWGVDGLELRDRDGRILRRWGNLVPGEPSPGQPEGAFDPLLRYLAVRAFGEPEGGEVLTVVSLIGTSREVLAIGPGQGFTWSGDGTGLYWLDAEGGLQAWSADPELASATLVGRGTGGRYPRLRVYDPAITPLQHAALSTSVLIELRDEGVSVPIMSAPPLQESFGNGVRSIIPAGIPGSFLAMTAGEEAVISFLQPVELAGRQRAIFEARLLGSFTGRPATAATRLVRAAVLSPGILKPGAGGNLTAAELAATRWFLQTESGQILYGPDGGLFTTVAEGSSLSTLAGQVFYLTPDGSTIQTVPGTGSEPGVILTAPDLEAERILAFGAMRRALFVLVAGDDGGSHIWQVPADSPLLATPLFPPAPSINSWAWIIYSSGDEATGGEILVEPDAGPTAEVLAARLDLPDGPRTEVIAVPLTIESVCGAAAGGACVVSTWPGSPLGFSPDANWLLVDDGTGNRAVSNVGRGSVLVPPPGIRIESSALSGWGPPDQVAWIEAR